MVVPAVPVFLGFIGYCLGLRITGSGRGIERSRCFHQFYLVLLFVLRELILMVVVGELRCSLGS